MTFWIKFWGVRGSIACPSPSHMKFGGNTSCIEVRAGDQYLVLDAGTGIRELSDSFEASESNSATLLLTHTHWDHINGFPFFRSLYRKEYAFRVMAGHLPEGGVRRTLAGQMAHPVFPVPLDELHAEIAFDDFRAGDSFSLDDRVHVRTTPLNHPNGATGYRIEHEGRSVCYVTDTEHVPGTRDQNILQLIDGADLVIYDSTYTDEEFVEHIGWGHSTWQEGVRLCQEASVKRLAIFHHDPQHDDAFMASVERDAGDLWDGAFVARERIRIDLQETLPEAPDHGRCAEDPGEP
ncbi:MAG: MBL fold metallo-hydrolase [Myxococcota bacterium]